jgi:PKD repeat protein
VNSQQQYKYNQWFSFPGWKLIILAFVALWFFEGKSQGVNDINKAFVIGQITCSNNNSPIAGQEVIIKADTAYDNNFIYHNKVYTNKEGLFIDTIHTEALKGGLIISTIDCYNVTHDTTIYFRFNWSEDNYLQPHFLLPSEIGTNGPQANFDFIQKPYGQSNLTFSFFDKTNNDNAVLWEWDFGDGIFSFEQNPEHTYSEPGIYYVKLTAVIDDPIYLAPVTTSIVKVVKASLQNYYHLGGHVKAGYFPIDIGEAYLYKIEDKDFTIIDTAIFNDNLGFYLFPQVIEGNYLIKADLHPSSSLFNEYLQTYYSNNYLWEEADTIFHYQTSTEYDINLIPNSGQLLPGPGAVAGKIVYDAGQTGGTKSGPACNIQIILFDNNGELVDICHSNDQGYFELTNLDLQTYDVYAEVTGKFTIPLNISLEPSNSLVNEITLIISSSLVHGSYTYGIGDHSSNIQVGNVYPNPVHNDLYLDIQLSSQESFEVSLMDTYGRIIENYTFDANQGMNKIHLNTDTYASGLYFIHVKQNNGQTVNRTFIKK